VSAIRVLIADDHALVRSGFRAILEALPDVTVVGEAGEGQEAMTLAQKVQPHVVLMDIAMPGLNGIDVTAQLTREMPYVRVIVVSMHASEVYVRRALAAGAAGYLLKDAEVGELELAVRAAARGDTYLSPTVSGWVIEGYVRPVEAEASGLEPLTARQREILQLVAEGKTTKEIAKRLKLGTRTVESHRADLMQRLDIHDLPGLVRYAIRVGLISPER
jgi:DNA-binding NarL/FixJ family response regulator